MILSLHDYYFIVYKQRNQTIFIFVVYKQQNINNANFRVYVLLSQRFNFLKREKTPLTEQIPNGFHLPRCHATENRTWVRFPIFISVARTPLTSVMG